MKKTRSIIAASLLFTGTSVHAQIIGGNGFLIGNQAEVGVAGLGGYEGADTLMGMPAGHHWRSDPWNTIHGFVADPNATGWTNYDGDFFTPGSPENGWGLEIGHNGGSLNNNCSDGFWGSPMSMPGAIVGWQNNSGCIQVDWEGTASASQPTWDPNMWSYTGPAFGADLTIHITYKLNTNNPFYMTEVTITNDGATTVDSLFYGRNVDPDNNETLSFDYTTDNTIVSQPIPGCEKALVSATQAAPWASYMGFGAIGMNFSAGFGGFSNRDISEMYYGNDMWGQFQNTVGANNFMDEAIFMTYVIESLPPGASETFKFVVILDAAQVDQALAELYYFDFSGGLGGPPAECVPEVDTAVTCPGIPVTIELLGAGINDFNWSWSPTTGLSPTTGTIVNASPTTTTTYTVTGTPVNPCYTATLDKIIVVDVLDPMDLTIDIVQPSCGMNDGSLDVTSVVGGLSPYTYQWTGGPASPAWNALGSGSYTITITDDNGCIADSTIALLNGAGLTGNLVSMTPATCGSPNGAFEVAAAGGSTPYTFDIGGAPQATGVFTGLTASNYTCTITDAGGCTYDVIVVVTDLSGLTTGILSQTDALCNGSADGTLEVNASGSVSPYTYDIGGGPQASGIFTGLPAGTYNITVSDGGGCSMVIPVTIGEPDPITPSIDLVTDILCNAGLDGVVDASATGGTSPFTFDIGSGPQATGLFNGLGAGNYTITFTDNNGCSVTMDTVVAEPTSVTISFSAFDAICNASCDGYAVVIPAGGTSPYTYSWSSGGSSANENNLCAGAYDLTVTDNNGCTVDTLNFPINEPAPMTVDNVSVGDELCPNDCQGTIDVIAAGATQFSIDGGATFMPAGNFVGLCAGAYNIVVEDASGCQASDNTVIATPPDVVADFTFGPQPTTLHDPQIFFSNESENGITYLWDFGDGGTATTFDATYEYSSDEPGQYTVCLTVTDANGCWDDVCDVVFIDDIFSIYVPNAFTPNADGINDYFLPVLNAEDQTNYEMYIFNRWGEQVFTVESPLLGWDGTYKGVLVEEGIYVWKIRAVDLYSNEKYEYIGHVAVVR